MISDPKSMSLLKQRAKLYASRVNPFENQSLINTVLVILVGDQRYGIELSEISEVFPIKSVTQVPGAPREFHGITNIRGKITTLINLKQLLGLPSSPEQTAASAILLRATRSLFAFKVDAIQNTVGIDFKELTPLAVLQNSIHSYTKGITRDQLIVLELSTILEHPLFRRNT
jgi:purine-binding chemotaxis protein CheW